MAVNVATRFALANKFQVLADCVSETFSFDSKPDVRYSSRSANQNSKTHYRNYILLDEELAVMSPGRRRGIVYNMIRRLSNPTQVAKESSTLVLIYELRLQALAWAFFGGREFSEVISRNLSSHAGYDEAHTEREMEILNGFRTAITNFQQGKIFTARAAFDVADKAFGELRHTGWVAKNSQ